MPNITCKQHNYHSSGYYLAFCLVFKAQRFGYWILSPSADETYLGGSNK
jgi:hypothetical protein